MPTNLTDANIDDTFGGILHSQGAPLPGSGKIDMYDGKGNKSSIQLGKYGAGATIYAGVNDDSFTVLGDLSATGRATIDHVEALGGVTGPNIPKAFVRFFGNDGMPYTGYGISSVIRENSGRYKIEFSDNTKTLLQGLTADHYHVQANISLYTADLILPKVYSTVVDGDLSDNDFVYIKCIKFESGTADFFDPKHVHVAIFKS